MYTVLCLCMHDASRRASTHGTTTAVRRRPKGEERMHCHAHAHAEGMDFSVPFASLGNTVTRKKYFFFLKSMVEKTSLAGHRRARQHARTHIEGKLKQLLHSTAVHSAHTCCPSARRARAEKRERPLHAAAAWCHPHPWSGLDVHITHAAVPCHARPPFLVAFAKLPSCPFVAFTVLPSIGLIS